MSRPPNGYPRNANNVGYMPGAMSSQARLNTPQPSQRPHSPGSSQQSGPQMSRAERFEDEKRRIIESCFSKLDAGGQLAESYITHIRIIEDAQYPSAPPPPESPEVNKKPRLIIIAVRSTGRVRMHKARENTNGSFSIGKTWNMEELSAIESYSNAATPPATEKEAQHRAWAGNVGFTVTITKPYYWQAGTSKEKDFFIASAVKIYRKYTKGQVPDLRGFEEREKNMILGAMPTQQGPATPSNQSQLSLAAGHQQSQSPAPALPQPPFVTRDQSRDESRYRRSPGPPPSISDTRPGSGPNGRRPSDQAPARFGPPQPPGPLMSNGPRQFASTEQMRSQSRDGRDAVPPQFRPGTSPAPIPDHRAPSFASTQRSPEMSQQSPMRTKSPPVVGYGVAPPPLRPQSPPRHRDLQPIDGTSEERKASTSSANSGSGADLFQQARQRYMNYQPGTSPTPPPQSNTPAIETFQPQKSAQNGALKEPVEKAPSTAGSSTGVDLGDAAAVGALTDFWGPEHAQAAPSPAAPSPAVEQIERFPTPNSVQEDGTLTPQRSQVRSPIVPPEPERTESEASIDLRPAPLNSTRTAREIASQAVAEPKVEETQRSPKRPKPVMPSALGISQLRGESPDISPAGTPDEEIQEEEQYRPGLGPMFKKKAIANRFRKAANASSAFKPRPGGAAEAILRAKAERDGEPDGITGVVPRPSTRERQAQEESLPVTPSTDTTPVEDFSVKQPEKALPFAPPTVEISSPQSPAQDLADPPDIRNSVELFDNPIPSQPQETPGPEVQGAKAEQRQVRQAQVKIKRRSAQQEKYLASLGIDRSLLDNKGLDFEATLADFGWSTEVLQPKQLSILESDIRREQGRVDAGSWLSHTDAAREERVTQVESLLDKAIAECDELEGLLTLYRVELSSLNDDIAFIEAQSQGLQVQSANQKLLQSELQGIVDTMSLGRNTMEPLRHGDLTDPRSLEQVENSLVRLYQAMLTMDPTLGRTSNSRPRSRGGFDENETANMSALREKKVTYDREANEFCKRLMQFLDTRFTVTTNQAKVRMLQVPRSGGLAKLNPDAVIEVRNSLWMYSPLILFTKEVNEPAWKTLLRMYYTRAGLMYTDAFKENISNLKRAARASTGDETDILFTTQEKEDPANAGLASTARKLTVKRSQTLAKTLRNPLGGDKGHHATERKQPGTMSRSETFALAMDEMAPKISEEQNFLVDLFHANSLEAEDFIDVISAAPPSARRGTNLRIPKPTDPDRNVASLVANSTSEIFGIYGRELDTMLSWSISDDPIQAVGVLASLGKHAFYLRDSSQEYLLQLVNELFDKLQTRFNKFVDEQIRAIEDTKVKIKKRKGVIAFMKIFPQFSNYVENCFASVAGNDYDGPSDCVLEVRRLVDVAYERLNRAMFDSLKVIAKESPVAGLPAKGAPQGADDPEDKEMLNYHILLIENMNHYIEEVEDGGREGVLADWKGRAQMERAEALEAYVSRVIRRPLGKLLDFLESTESILASNNNNPASVSSRPSYNRKAMRHLLQTFDTKTVRRDIDTLRKRIEKHFGDAEENEVVSRNLVGLVTKECERAYERVLERTERVKQTVYPDTEGEKDVIIDFGKGDIAAGFRR